MANVAMDALLTTAALRVVMDEAETEAYRH